MKIFQPIYGAVRLAQGKRDGVSLFGESERDFWQSFYAAIIVAPLFFIFITLQSNTGIRSAVSVNFYTIHAISYVIGWVLFPLVMIHLVKIIERQQFYIRLIVAYNWAAVIQNAIFLPFAILFETGLISGPIAEMTNAILLIIILFYIRFIIKITLNISGLLSTGIVLLDVGLWLMLTLVTENLIRLNS